MFQTKVLETFETHILCSVTFSSENRVVYETTCEMWDSQTDHRWQYNTAHALCILDNKATDTHWESSCVHVCTVHQWRLKHFIIQQMHKYIIRRYNYNYYKIFKIFNIAPTCFGSQGIHHQGALYSVWLKLQHWFYRVRWHGRIRCYSIVFIEIR